MSTMGYVTTLTGAEDSANLSIDFEKQSYKVMEGGKQVSKSFSDIITFTRSTTGGRFNEKGLYEVVAVNQPRFDYDPITKVLKGLLFEEQRTNIATYSGAMSNWNRTRVDVRPNAAISPDGSLTAVKLVSDTVADWHYATCPSFTVPTGTTYSQSVYAKAGEWPRIRLGFLNTNIFGGAPVFDLTTGTRVSGNVGEITPVGDGWYRCTFEATSKIAGSSAMSINSVKAGETDANTAGDGVSGIYVWGAQVETGGSVSSHILTDATFTSRSTPATYFDNKGVLKTAGVDIARSSSYNYDTSGKLLPSGLLLESASVNLLPNSSNFVATAWGAYSESGASVPTRVIPNKTISPSGNMDASLLVMGSGNCLLTQNISATVNLPYTMSVWMKGVVGGEKVRLEFRSVTSQGTSWGSPITLTKEWVRYTVSGMNSSLEGVRGFQFRKNAVDGGEQSFYIWGAQVEQKTAVSSYIATGQNFVSRASTATYFDQSGVMQTAPINTPRSEAYSRTGVRIGLLVESATTNLVKYSNCFGSGWTDTSNSPNKPVVTGDSAVAPDGTTTATTIEFPDKEAYTTQTWNQQVGQLVAGSTLAPSVWLKADKPVTMQIRKGDGVAGYEAVQVTTEWQRFESTPGANTGTTFNFGLANPASVATTPFKLYAWGAQLEYGNYATSEIVTGAVAVTRAADVYSSPTAARGADVSSSVATTRAIDAANVNTLTPWYNATAGTLTSIVVPGARLGATRSVTVLDNGSQTNRIALFDITTGGNAAGRCTLNGTENNTTDLLNAFVQNVVTKTAISWSVPLGFVACVGGKTSSTVMPASIPEVTTLRIGSSAVGGSFNGHIKAVGFYPLRLSNSQLQLLTE